MCAYCPEKQQAVLGSPAKRSASSCSVNVPTAWDGMDVHVYGFVVSNPKLAKKRTSPTNYLGTGEVA